MGCDKARIEHDGQLLIARQIELARKLKPAELFISGRADTDYSALGRRAGLVALHDAETTEWQCSQNWNSPADLPLPVL